MKKEITLHCKELYEEKGASAVYDFANKYLVENPTTDELVYQRCPGCDADTPHWYRQCLVCGGITETPFTPEREFAYKTAELLFEMRIEDNRMVDNLDYVPEEFINQTLDHPVHIRLMKLEIYNDILKTLFSSSSDYNKDAMGNLVVTEEVHDCWYCADHYVENLWDEEEEKREELEKKPEKPQTVKYKVWIEVEKITTDPEDDLEDYEDMECPVGVSYVDSLEEAVDLQNQIVKTFGTIQ